MAGTSAELTQGIRQHLSQFSLYVLLVFATALSIGSERTVVPVLGREVLGVASLFVVGAGVLGMAIVDGYAAWIAMAGFAGVGIADTDNRLRSDFGLLSKAPSAHSTLQPNRRGIARYA